MEQTRTTRSITPGQGAAAIARALEEHPKHLELILEEGDYHLHETIRLRDIHEDVVIRGRGQVRLIGGVSLRGLAPVTDPAIRGRLDPLARDRVLVCRLADCGVAETASLSRRGYSGAGGESHNELFRDGVPMTLSRYPKGEAYLTITGYEAELMNECEELIGQPDKAFRYDDPRPRQWRPDKDIWAHGYWCWDWANSYEHIARLDAAKGEILLGDPPADRVRGYKPGQRFCFLNILEEVNAPGDYYIDRASGLLYFYPDSGFTPDSELLLSTLGGPFLALEGSRHVTLEGLDLECARGNGLTAKDCQGLLIDKCFFRNLGNYAVKVEYGHNVRIVNSTLHDLGDGGVRLFGGDRLTLEPADMEVSNNHFYRIASWSRCYCPAILAEGVGIAITGNLIHDCPHTAILWGGNDFTIERNEIYSVVLETGDAGAIYAGRDVTFRGNRVCGNYIHHLGGVGMGTMGIYNDDALCGTVMEDNLFFEVGRAVMLGGGMDFLVNNNVFVKCYPAIHMDSRAAHTEFFWGGVYEQMRKALYDARQSFTRPNDPGITLDCTKPPYMDRYPELKGLQEVYETGRQFTAAALVSNNVFCAKPRFRYYQEQRDANLGAIYDCGEPADLTLEQKCTIFDTRQDVNSNWSPGKGTWTFAHNYTAAPEDFDGVRWGIPAVKEDSPALAYGHKPVDFQAIGLREEGRAESPVRVFTCLEYPYKGDKQPLTLGIKNMGNRRAEGSMYFVTTNPNVRLYVREVPFSLEPGQEAWQEVGELAGEAVFCIEARSRTPGVRPARAENIEGSWKRF